MPRCWWGVRQAGFGRHGRLGQHTGFGPDRRLGARAAFLRAASRQSGPPRGTGQWGVQGLGLGGHGEAGTNAQQTQRAVSPCPAAASWPGRGLEGRGPRSPGPVWRRRTAPVTHWRWQQGQEEGRPGRFGASQSPRARPLLRAGPPGPHADLGTSLEPAGTALIRAGRGIL